jgi:hypothetical protein
MAGWARPCERPLPGSKALLSRSFRIDRAARFGWQDVQRSANEPIDNAPDQTYRGLYFFVPTPLSPFGGFYFDVSGRPNVVLAPAAQAMADGEMQAAPRRISSFQLRR